ncbi:uncharacterized protein LOC143237300 [Tachypleus tridentatus]|uniref:uncharacterized protein LOC143237300 n=1 Tax=Tachypleus tridentatus TaxID=6853 RepID=UPI003FD27215
MLRVGVIGAGAAGLVAARHLAAQSDLFNFVVYEQTGEVGGTWYYRDEVGTDEFGLPIHSSVYKNMRTNIPKNIMAFPDFPFPIKENCCFVHHTEVHSYLKDYTKYFDVAKFIQFHSYVQEVRPVTNNTGQILWNISTKNLVTKVIKQQVFDAVIICNGRFTKPKYPDIKGIESFPGWVLHSHDYRVNDPFKGKGVVILGGGPSGIDISREVAEVAEQVLFSHNLDKKCREKVPQNFTEICGISEINGSVVKFMNGHQFEADVLLLCTGYNFDYKFLHPKCNVSVRNQRVVPLYKHLIHCEFPTMAIFGVQSLTLPFPLFHQQVLLFLKVLRGSVKLPSEKEMREDADADFNYRIQMGLPARYAHKMSNGLLWKYDDDISRLGGFPPIPKIVRDQFNSSSFACS